MVPFKITSAGVGMVRTEELTVPQIRWVGATSAGHQCIIQDKNDNILWHSVAAGSNYVESDTVRREWKGGFKVPTMDSGILYIYAVVGKDAN